MDGAAAFASSATVASGGDFGPFARREADGGMTLHAMVEGARCGGCVAKIERTLRAEPAVLSARVNLSTRRIVLRWRGAADLADTLAAKVEAAGFKLIPFDPVRLAQSDRSDETRLLRALAVAGFAAANVMLLSVSIWSGAVEGMDAATRDMLHWFSALIALPALVYSARPFVRSAWNAIRRGSMNMDLPIAVGIVLTAGTSLLEVIHGAPHAYFDSAITLVFFLLLGRYLDLRARGQARSAAERLLALRSRAVTVIDADGAARKCAVEAVSPGWTILAAAGERIGVDGTVAEGRSDVDTSLITGETVPSAVQPGDPVFAGALNISAPLRITARAAGEDTLLAEILRLMEAAEQSKSRYVALSDRISRLYAPVVHIMALATFATWWAVDAADWRTALVNAIAVLIITCPCALGLAVPAVQVIATGRLMRQGLLLKSSTALERLAAVDTVVFDKTGTLTLGQPELVADAGRDPALVQLAAGMARASTHPLARALVRAAPGAPARSGVREEPGQGLAMTEGDDEVRLGSRTWCGVADTGDECGPELWLKRPGSAPVRFAFADAVRTDAANVVNELLRHGYRVRLISGDRKPTVAAIASAVGISDWQAAASPADKAKLLQKMAAEGRTVLMVGDGLNDAPALATAHVSASPSCAADITQTAADAVFQGAHLAPVVELLDTATRARRLVRQNIGAAIAYNLVAVPIAMAGLLTPFLAAIAMSSSSIGVVANALRLARRQA